MFKELNIISDLFKSAWAGFIPKKGWIAAIGLAHDVIISIQNYSDSIIFPK